MDVFSISSNKIADKIMKNSVIIEDRSTDKTYYLIDDGNSNLVFSYIW